MNSMALSLLIKSSLLIGVAAVVNRLWLRRKSAASRHQVWTLALGAVLLLPMLSMAVPDLVIPIRVTAAAPGAALGDLAMDEEAFTPVTSPSNTTATVGRTAGPEDPGASPAATTRTISWERVALATYLAGLLLLGLRLVYGRWILTRIVRQSTHVQDPEWRALLRECEALMGVTQPARLLRSLDRSMPMTFGLRTPTIVIPAIADTWDTDRRRAVILHELAHIDRRDCLTQFLAEITCAAYWIHPAVWLVAERLKVERELACDDRVLTVGDAAPAAPDYASHLLDLAYSLGGYRSPALVVSMARRTQIEGRMLAVLDAARNRVNPSLRARVVGLVATAILVVPLAAAEAVIVPRSSEQSAPETLAMRAEPSAVAASQPPAPPAPPAPLAPLASSWEARAEREAERAVERREIQLPGAFEVRSSDEAGVINIRISDRPGSMHGFSVPIDQLEGFSPSILTGQGGPATFTLRRDAGTFTFEGIFRPGVGAGAFNFTPSAGFAAEMVKRGFQSPDKTDQYQLARGNIGFAYLDELTLQKYERPTLADLVRAGEHGVSLDYLRGMGSAGFKLGRLEALVRTRDHGVTPKFIAGLAAAGISGLSAEDLVRVRDHGVSAEYIGALRAFGYKNVVLDDLIRARDHGVSAEYIRGLTEAGFAQLSLDQLIRTRDSGVTAGYLKDLREAGHKDLTLEELVRAREHGVGADFVRQMTALLRVPLMMDELVRARDHGVSVEFVKALREFGYKEATLDDFIRLRDHGVSATFVRDQNAGPRGRLSIDALVRRRDRGM